MGVASALKMRMPIRSESDAFRFTLGGAAVIAASLVMGWLTQAWVGVAVFAIAAAALFLAYVRVARADRRPVLHDAADEPHAHGPAAGQRHILVIANEALSGDELGDLLRGADRDTVEVDVLAPLLSTRLHLGVTDIDRELSEARARLDRSLAWAREQGIVVRGEVGDPSPITAIEDELRDFGADEVIVVTNAREHETWQERGELERLRRELDMPVTHVVVGDADGEVRIDAAT
jgi:hypothetical protein